MFQFVVLATVLAVASAGTLGPIRGIGQAPIVGGTEASIQDAPWQVALQYNGGLRCGGSIISRTVILTAAHCTSGTSAGAWNVRAGSSQHASGGTSYKVSRVSTNSQYNSNTLDYDIAVLILSSSITIDNLNTRIITLPAKNLNVPAGSSALVTGWGTTSSGGSIPATLRKVTLPVVAQSECASAYSGFNTITDRMICGGRLGVGGVDACQGDSGGPFVVGSVIVGVTSWGNGCALARYPGVWARVPALVDWVEQQL
jgi:trypsin